MNKLIKDYFDELYPNASCELRYKNDYELLISVILSAQTTDKKVNEITLMLFDKYKTVIDLSLANEEEVKEIIKPLGMSNMKSKSIINCCNKVVCDYNGVIPNEHDKLLTLDGVGNKTANVFLAVWCGIPRFAVDTHVKRVAVRLGISKKDSTVEKIEVDLMEFFDKKDWIDVHHQMIFFGRYFCTAKKPNCINCKLKDICQFN